MKVLVITRNAWDNTNSIGNTLTNFFKDLDDIEFANIYFRSSKPNNSLCKLYYHVTETEILKKWFVPQKIGRAFSWEEDERLRSSSVSEKNEKTIVRFIHKYNLKLAYKVSDYVWYRKKWQNKNLKNFVETFAPDVIFTFVKSAPQYYLTIKYLKENFSVPLFSWIADDEYTGLLQTKSLREIANLQYILKQSKIVRGCSGEICDYYNSIFCCDATPLYKGCDIMTSVAKMKRDLIKIVYAGNLLYGRLEIIRRIADDLEICANEGKNILFEIYSNTPLSAQEVKYFEQKKCVKYMGKQEYTIIMQQLADADIVLHVESFDEEQIVKTKYSFSTKIIDCLQSGSILLAVGPSTIASIKYVKKIPGTYIIDDLNNLSIQLKSFIEDTESYPERIEQIKNFACTYHDSIKNSMEIRSMLDKIVEGDS